MDFASNGKSTALQLVAMTRLATMGFNRSSPGSFVFNGYKDKQTAAKQKTSKHKPPLHPNKSEPYTKPHCSYYQLNTWWVVMANVCKGHTNTCTNNSNTYTLQQLDGHRITEAWWSTPWTLGLPDHVLLVQLTVPYSQSTHMPKGCVCQHHKNKKERISQKVSRHVVKQLKSSNKGMITDWPTNIHLYEQRRGWQNTCVQSPTTTTVTGSPQSTTALTWPSNAATTKLFCLILCPPGKCSKTHKVLHKATGGTWHLLDPKNIFVFVLYNPNKKVYKR